MDAAQIDRSVLSGRGIESRALRTRLYPSVHACRRSAMILMICSAKWGVCCTMNRKPPLGNGNELAWRPGGDRGDPWRVVEQRHLAKGFAGSEGLDDGSADAEFDLAFENHVHRVARIARRKHRFPGRKRQPVRFVPKQIQRNALFTPWHSCYRKVTASLLRFHYTRRSRTSGPSSSLNTRRLALTDAPGFAGDGSPGVAARYSRQRATWPLHAVSPNGRVLPRHRLRFWCGALVLHRATGH